MIYKLTLESENIINGCECGATGKGVLKHTINVAQNGRRKDSVVYGAASKHSASAVTAVRNCIL